jgi:hypothetical protein
MTKYLSDKIMTLYNCVACVHRFSTEVFSCSLVIMVFVSDRNRYGTMVTWTLYSGRNYCVLCHHHFVLDISHSCQQCKS